MSKNKFIRRKQETMKNIIILLVLILGLGYALLQQNLSITGLSSIGNPKWDIHWENVQVKSGSVSASTPVINSAKTTVTYSVVLNTPGNYYEFTVDAVNSGTIDGMIESITSKLNGATITTLPAYLEYTVSYYDGVPLATNQLLAAGTTEKYKVRIKYRDDIELNQIPATNQTLSLQFTVKYKQADENTIAVDHSFNGHSWETIINNIRSGNTNNYNVGDTKEVDMGTFGTHTLRIANKSTPSECSTTGFSQTACGFVLEFADIITKHRMNPWDSSVTTTGNGNIGGWPASEMRTYVNSDIYNALPTDLKNGIINTTVVSGHGRTNGETNFTSTDKMYLLSTKEVWGKEGTTNVINNDTAEVETRQLDYYSSQNVTTSNYSGTLKQRNGSNEVWWLRSAYLDNYIFFYVVNNGGTWIGDISTNNRGISPAFRIG